MTSELRHYGQFQLMGHVGELSKDFLRHHF